MWCQSTWLIFRACNRLKKSQGVWFTSQQISIWGLKVWILHTPSAVTIVLQMHMLVKFSSSFTTRVTAASSINENGTNNSVNLAFVFTMVMISLLWNWYPSVQSKIWRDAQFCKICMTPSFVKPFSSGKEIYSKALSLFISLRHRVVILVPLNSSVFSVFRHNRKTFCKISSPTAHPVNSRKDRFFKLAWSRQ